MPTGRISRQSVKFLTNEKGDLWLDYPMDDEILEKTIESHSYFNGVCIPWALNVGFVVLPGNALFSLKELDYIMGYDEKTGVPKSINYMDAELELQEEIIDGLLNNLQPTSQAGKDAVEVGETLLKRLDEAKEIGEKFTKAYFEAL